MIVSDIEKKAVRLLSGTMLIFALLVATHLGEFWPFSIYPMFSQAGHPWTRSMVRDVTESDSAEVWKTVTFEELPGDEFPMDVVGISQNDVSNFLQKAGTWDQRKINGMRRLFSDELDDRDLLLYRVVGRLDQNPIDTVIVEYTPFLLMTKDTTIINPHLDANP